MGQCLRAVHWLQSEREIQFNSFKFELIHYEQRATSHDIRIVCHQKCMICDRADAPYVQRYKYVL